jgi:hypothetical protein
MDQGLQGAVKMWSEVARWRLGGAEAYHLVLVAATLTLSTITPRWPWTILKLAAHSFLSAQTWFFWLVLLLCQALHLAATYSILKCQRQLPIRCFTIGYPPLDRAVRLASRVINPLQGAGNLRSTALFLVASVLCGATFVRSYLEYRRVEGPGVHFSSS